MAVKKVLLSDGSSIPQIGFGTGSVWKGTDMTAYVKQALDAGFTHIDSAQYYRTEDSVGAALKQSGVKRDEVYITTKYGFGSIPAAMDASLTQLGVDYVDLYLIHNPLSVINDLAGAWAQMEALRIAGLTKSIGVSNFMMEHLVPLLEIAKITPVVNQIQLHPYNYEQMKPLLRLCAAHRIAIEAYSSLTPITHTPGGPVDAPLARAAERIGGTPAQVIFKWLMAKGIVVVTTTSKQERLEEYLATPQLPDLTAEEIAAIEAAGAEGPPSMDLMPCSKELCSNAKEWSAYDLESAMPPVAPRRKMVRAAFLVVSLAVCSVVLASFGVLHWSHV